MIQTAKLSICADVWFYGKLCTGSFRRIGWVVPVTPIPLLLIIPPTRYGASQKKMSRRYTYYYVYPADWQNSDFPKQSQIGSIGLPDIPTMSVFTGNHSGNGNSRNSGNAKLSAQLPPECQSIQMIDRTPS